MNFVVLIIGLSTLLLIGNVHGEESNKVPEDEIQNSQTELNSDHNAEHQDGSNAQCKYYKINENSEVIFDYTTGHEDEFAQYFQTSKIIDLQHNNEIKKQQDKKMFDEISDLENQDYTTNNRKPKIIGGKPDHKNEIKYQVVLHNGTNEICGATILSDRYLLSAAHCFINWDDEPYGEQIYVLIGTKKLSKHHENIPKVKGVYMPKEFNGTREEDQMGDIAVLKLTKDLGLDKDPRIAKINLPEPLEDGSYDMYGGKEAIVAGYGANYIALRRNPASVEDYKIAAAAFPETLLAAKVDVLNQSDCENIWSPIKVTSSRMCGKIQGRGHRGICMGDSGNALVYNNTAIGIVSLGYETCNENCPYHGKPTIYTRVSSYVEFINDVMEDEISYEIRSFHILDIED